MSSTPTHQSMTDAAVHARRAVAACRRLATYSDEPGYTTRLFLSKAARAVLDDLSAWMTRVGMTVRIDAAGNLRGTYEGASGTARRLLIGSHLDTVPHAGAFDGVLGAVLGVTLVEMLAGRRFPFAIEVLGFSEEEGVRFGVPFIGSRALVGTLDEALLQRRDAEGCSVSDALRGFGLDPSRLREARADALGYLEIHIEQGPVLDRLGIPLGVVNAIVGQTRANVVFIGEAAHAGTTPMDVRRDALAAAAAWITSIETSARRVDGLVATVGRVDVEPNAGNVIAGRCRLSVDIRHGRDDVRRAAAESARRHAAEIATRRGLSVEWETVLDQPAVAMDGRFVSMLEHAVEQSGAPVQVMPSGAGHDAMILAARMPAAMLFVRSPGGVSHHPAEAVAETDVAAALNAALRFLDALAARHESSS